jgi:hypothetical protein
MEPHLAIKLVIALVFIICFAVALKGTMRKPGSGQDKTAGGE